MSLLCHHSTPKPHSNIPETELFHRLRLHQKSPAPAGFGSTTLLIQKNLSSFILYITVGRVNKYRTVLFIIQKYVKVHIQWKMNIFKSFCFSLAKKQAGADPKKSALAPAQILNRLRLQQKKPRLRPAPAPQHWPSVSCNKYIFPPFFEALGLFQIYVPYFLLECCTIRNTRNCHFGLCHHCLQLRIYKACFRVVGKAPKSVG